MRKLLCFCLLSFAVFAYAEDKRIEQIKILMTEEEKVDFKNMKSDSEKESFVTDFWSKRDPTPGTPENEYKDNFETHLKQVNELMKDKKAYESDRGQTLMLLGPPAEQKKSEPGEAGDDESGPMLKETWIYRTLPAEVASGEVQLLFKASGGSWKFVDKKEAQALLEKARRHAIQIAQAAAHGAQEVPEKQPQAATKAVGEMIAPVSTPDVKAALDAVAAGNAPQDIALKALTDSFMTSEGEMFATFAVGTAADVAGARVGIRVLDGTGALVQETEVPFVDPSANPPEAAGYFQTKLPATPGDYSIALAVVGSGKTGGIKKTLSVPDHKGKFSISSVILSKKFNQLTEAKPEKTPYTFGKIKVDPTVDRLFTKADDLIIVYEAYNFQVDPAKTDAANPNGMPNLEVVVSFQKDKEKPKSSQPGPANGLVTGKKMTVPTSFPLTAFPAGEWKITLTITDKVLGQSVTRESNFTIK